MIINRQKELKEGLRENKPHNILDVLIDELEASNGKIKLEEIVQQFITFFFAGMDTTGQTVSMCFYYLAKYPEKATKVYEEINKFVGNLKFSDLNKLDQTHAFIKETLRISTPLPMAVPRTPIHKMKIGGFEIDPSYSVK